MSLFWGGAFVELATAHVVSAAVASNKYEPSSTVAQVDFQVVSMVLRMGYSVALSSWLSYFLGFCRNPSTQRRIRGALLPLLGLGHDWLGRRWDRQRLRVSLDLLRVVYFVLQNWLMMTFSIYVPIRANRPLPQA